MPVRALTREQAFLLPPELEELVGPDHPARFVASFVDSQTYEDWLKMGIHLEGNRLGAPSYDARLMLSVWIYGFMEGIRSTRKLERACREHIPLRWLTSMQTPDHVSLWRFYKLHREGMRVAFRRTVSTAVEMELVDLVIQALDGTKIKGDATKRHTYDEKGLERLMERVEKAIEELEAQEKSEEGSREARLPEELWDAQRRQEKIAEALARVRAKDGPKEINLTDEDARLVRGTEGVVAGYNGQAMVSKLKEEYGGGHFITAESLTNAADDHDQLIGMIVQAEENTGQRAETTLADGGYHSGANLKQCAVAGYNVLMSEAQRRARESPYHKDRFTYDAETDAYICPHGMRLTHRGVKRRKGKDEAQIYLGDAGLCRECPAFGECTRDQRHGRGLEIGPYEDHLRAHRELMAQEDSRELYKLRKAIAEPIFGTLKHVLGVRRLLLRGLENTQPEWSLLNTALNLRALWRPWLSLRESWRWTS